MNGWRFVLLPKYGDSVRGFLSPAESNMEVPFILRRTYWIYGMAEGIARGSHAHRTAEQVFFCLSGSVRFQLENRHIKESITINGEGPNVGLYVGPLVWHVMDMFQPGTVLLALASEPNNELEYIRDYSEYERLR